jgi:HK97 gp10 family phage protein
VSWLNIAGIAEGHANLRKARAAVGQAIASGQAQLARDVLARMEAGVPRDSGKLASTLRVEQRGAQVVDVIAGDDDTFYLGFVEFGTSIWPGGNPFVRMAAAGADTALERVMTSEAKRRMP